MSSERCRILSPYPFQPSSLTLNLKEEVRTEDGNHLEIEVADSDAYTDTLRNLLSNELCRSDSDKPSNKPQSRLRRWRAILQVPLGYVVVMVQTIVKALLSVWETLVDADGFLALPAKALCGAILGVIAFHPFVLWALILGKPAPLCYPLYFLFLFYVSTLLIVGSVIGYLREGG